MLVNRLNKHRTDSLFSFFINPSLPCSRTHFNQTAGQTFKMCASLTGSLRQKCHLSTCALMINTVLMISINFRLHSSRSALLGFCHGPEFGPMEISEGSWLPLIVGDFGCLHTGESIFCVVDGQEWIRNMDVVAQQN